jgi:hypothetical protein
MGWFIVDGHQDIATALLEATDRDFAAPAPAAGEVPRVAGVGAVAGVGPVD